VNRWLKLAAIVLVSVGLLAWRVWVMADRSVSDVGKVHQPAPEAPDLPPSPFLRKAQPFALPDGGAPGPAGLSAGKAARVAKVRRDYEEIRTKTSADYRAAGENFPGGINAFLRQLALLELEMHRDLAAVLTPPELEDHLMKESTTGQTLQHRLEGVEVTDEQRRLVFRAQQEFDDRFSLIFDVAPAALWERTKAQFETREKIRATLGDDAYAAWLRTEDPSYAALRALVVERGLPSTATTDLWRVKDDWTLRKLEIAAQPGLTLEQRAQLQAALAEQIRSQVAALVGPDAMQPGSEALGWLPAAP
jgi:hypothetical protein